MDQPLTHPARTQPATLASNARKRRAWIVLAGTLAAILFIADLTERIQNTESGAVALAAAGLVGLIVVVGLAVWDVRIGLAGFLVASALSPRIGTDFRLTDAVVPFLIVIWGGRILCGERANFRTPLSVPILLVAVTMVLSTLYGAGIATIPDWQSSLLLIGKRLEYFLIFYMTLNITRSRGWARVLVVVFLVGAVLGAILSLAGAQHDAQIGASRAVGFDDGNYNTFSGFMVMAVGLAVAGALDTKSRSLRVALGLCALLFVVAICQSYSREGYIVLVVALSAIGFLRYRGIIPILVAAAMCAPILFPDTVIRRAYDTVDQIRSYRTASPGSNSYAARVSAWERRWDGWIRKHPWAGNGVGSVELSVDNEFVLRWAESGVIGLAAFLLLLATTGKYIRRCARMLRGTEMEPFAYGLLAAFVALLVNGWVAATWTTIRTMEPFWVLLGAVGAAAMAAREADRTGETADRAADISEVHELRGLYAGV